MIDVLQVIRSSDFMKYPFCNEEVKVGEFRSVSDGEIYRLFKDIKYKGLFLNEEKVENQGALH